jgi:broad specificity phosphatase PhoE
MTETAQNDDRGLTRIFLIRHGENQANLTGEFSYQLVDYPLTAKGVLQARQTAAWLQDRNVARVYTSPLERARQTAEIIAVACAAPLTVLEAFREVNVGSLEKGPHDEAAWQLHDRIIAAWWEGRRQVRFPGGESYIELLARVERGYRRMLEGSEGQTLVLVAHAGSLKLPLQSLCANVVAEELRRSPQRNCAIAEVEGALVSDQIQLHLLHWGDTAHLTGEAANFVSGREQVKRWAAAGARDRTDS